MRLLIQRIQEQKKKESMNVICLNDEALYALINQVVARLKEEQNSDNRK